tara:strand:- start:834 stop:1220 length:387 start_codon:yes stop_codon:yes gene_type:complete
MDQIRIWNDESKGRALQAIGALDLKREWRVIIKRWSNNRTLAQNNTMWMAFSDIAEYTGHTIDEIHDYCVGMFLAPTTRTVLGKIVTTPRSTASLEVDEMVKFTEQIHAWAQTELDFKPRHPDNMERT